MTNYLIRRLLQILPITLGIVTLIFLLIHLIPGDPAIQIAGDGANPAQVAQVRERLGLNKPLLQQYLDFVGGLVKADLGRSFVTNEPVTEEIVDRYPATIELALGSMLIALLVAFPLGMLSGIKRNSIFDNVARVFALIGVSMPNFWLGPLLIMIFAVYLGWLPVSGRDGIENMILPSLTMGLSLSAILTRMIRISISEELGQLYVLTALAKGVSRTKAIFKHALRNALIPVVTIVGLQFGALLTGAIITEQIFAYPGLGRLLIQSITSRDYPMVQGVILVIALTYIVVNLITDLFYAFIDPRISYE
ncbi:MAG: ABC transporter permease [Acidobacteria bacterium]|nr:ABC transporter permease [Acidobacteriota bacterium]